MNYLNNKFLIPAVVAVVVIALGAAGFLYFKSRTTSTSNNPQNAQEEVKKLVLEVGKLIDLPTDETPTVATVKDISKLKNQPFFQKAKNGNKVLIYGNAKKVILYDPILKKILDVAPINIGSSAAQPAQVKIGLRNGTTTIGLTNKVELEIKKVQPQINITTQENASKVNYEKTTIVIFNNSYQDLANSLTTILKGASVGELPQGEEKPKDVDILIILGKDRV